MTKMIPPVHTTAVMMSAPKQKIGFSIESIVGNDTNATAGITNSNQNSNDFKRDSASGPSSPPQTPPSTLSFLSTVGNTHLPSSHTNPAHTLSQHGLPPNLVPQLLPAQQHAIHQQLLMQQQHQFNQQHGFPTIPKPHHDIQNIFHRLQNANAAALAAISNGSYSPPSGQTRLSPECDAASAGMSNFKRERSPMSAALEQAENPSQRIQPPHTPPKSVSPQSSLASSPPSLPIGSPQNTPQATTTYAKPQGPCPTGPIIVPGMPGLVRPFPVAPGAPPLPPPPPPQPGMPDIKPLPPYINAPPELPPQHNHHLFAAAQFQMALQANHVLGPAAAAAAAAGLPPHAAAFMPGPIMPRDSMPFWLLGRQSRMFSHRFPGNFLLQPFRKPKRVRTAFSPSQLLKLEHAFESNQYVVGAERKTLAQSLNLTETQVKVWFQNRRTKHKRMQQEDGKGNSEPDSHASGDEDDDELIDMEMDDCPSDDEHDLDPSHLVNHSHNTTV